jgi:hypothetical protein
MESLHSRYPQDSEAAIFYAVSLIANASLNDKTYANQKKATQILEPIILQQPRHPGVAHYIIHADDNPVLAPLALDAAKHYSQIAPDSPHALHMPSHIFTRLGLWDDSIASNLASTASARKQKLAGDELHALDYLVYAHLQTGRITEARKLTQQLPVFEPDDAALYDLRRTCAKLCHVNGGELEQIQFLLGHASVLTTERYLGCKQNLEEPVHDRFGCLFSRTLDLR